MTKNRIIAKDIFVNNDTHITQLNNNDVIVGPSGSGKTRGYVLPNIMQAQESMIITDTKNSLYEQTAGYLQTKGYVVHKIDFTGKTQSTIGYNPMDYIKYNSITDLYDNASTMKLARIIVPSSTHSEPFWNESANLLCASMITYVMNECVVEDHNINSVQQIVQYNEGGRFLKMIQLMENIGDENEVAKLYSIISAAGNADKTIDSIYGIFCAYIQTLNSVSSRNLSMMKNRIWFPNVGKQKMALFVNVSDSDHSTDAIQSIFYSQALQSLLDTADVMPTNRLKVPVRFMFDDFASGTTIQNFDQIISVVRSREIYTSIIIQSLSQLNSIYNPEVAKTILNNCDHMLYLGGQDHETIEMIAQKADRMVQTITELPIDQCISFERGDSGKIVKRYDISNHPEFTKLNLPIERDNTPLDMNSIYEYRKPIQNEIEREY